MDAGWLSMKTIEKYIFLTVGIFYNKTQYDVAFP